MRPGEERIYPKEVQSVGAMIEAMSNGWRVKAWCTRCPGIKQTTLLYLYHLMMQNGPSASLIDAHLPCIVPGCTGELIWLYSPSEGTPFRRLP